MSIGTQVAIAFFVYINISIMFSHFYPVHDPNNSLRWVDKPSYTVEGK
jgi:uncharacterized protein YybS (DUF2232 family)